MILCNRCGGLIRPGGKFCPYCRQDLIGQPNVCPFCRKETHPDSKYCSRCGKSQEAVGAICPRCSRPNRKDVRFCSHCGSQLNRKPPEHPYSTGKLPSGVVLGGRCVIVRKIAQGGMGAVYEAASTTGQTQRLAIKEMSFSVLQNLKPEQKEEMVRSFYREYDLLRKLNHPNLARAFDYIEEQGRCYFIMEFLDGQTLEAILKKVGPGHFLSTHRVMTWGHQLCDVLDYLHSQNPPVIYRDLKPSNVMELTCSSHLKLFDFGIARFYKAGKSTDTVRFGTDGYLAPEIIAHHSQTNVKTDLYALGVMLHELLTGRDPQLSPFLHPPAHSINPQVPESLSIAIQHALDLNPDRRVGSAAIFKDEMLRAVEQPVLQSELRSGSSLPGIPTGIESTTSPPPQPAWYSKPPSPPSARPAIPQIPEPPNKSSASAPPAVASIPSSSPAWSPIPPPPSASFKISTSFLYLGKIPSGQRADGTLGFDQPPNCSGKIESSTPWLVPTAERFTAGERVVVIRAETHQLAPGKWQPPSSSIIYQRIPGFLRSWIAFHLHIFVPGVQKHEGNVRLRASGAQPQEVIVRVDIAPPGWKVTLGWLIAIGLLSAEVFILGLILLLVIFLLLN